MQKKTVLGRHDVVVTDVQWNATPSGDIVPNVYFDTLTQGDYTLSNVVVYSAPEFVENGCGIGAQIRINNGAYVRVLKPNGRSDNAPQFCPFCGQPLEYEPTTPVRGRLKCMNRFCEGVLARQIAYYTNYVGIPIGEVMAETIVPYLPHKALYDIYDLQRDDWVEALSGSSAVQFVDDIMDGVEAARHMDLETFLTALYIRGLSVQMTHEIAKQVDGSWDRFIQRIIHHDEWIAEQSDVVNYGLNDWFRDRITLTDRLAEKIEFRAYAWDIEDMIDKRFRIFGNTRYFESPAKLRQDIIRLGGEVPKFEDEEIDCIVSNLKWRPESSEADELYHYCLEHPFIPVLDEWEYLERTRDLREGIMR